MGDGYFPGEWSELLQSIRPFGESDLAAVLASIRELLSLDAAAIGGRDGVLAHTGVWHDRGPNTVIELEHSESTLRILRSEQLTVEERTPLELLCRVLDLALLSLDRRSEQIPTPMIAPMGTKDRLTDTINRDAFSDFLDIEFAAGPSSASIIVLGLDGMGIVNDTLGHTAGDVLLSTTADRLRETLRSCDIVSRLGGDMFGIYCPNMDAELTMKLTGRLQAAISEPISVRSNELRVTASAGVASRTKGEKAASLLSSADLALQSAKAHGVRQMALFDGDLQLQVEDRRAMAVEFVEALADNQLSTALEPIVHLPSSAVVGVEARVLWDHPTRGQIDRSEFIDLAELIGRVSDVERAVVEFAILTAGSNEKSVRTGVNLSGSTLRDRLAVDWLVERLGASDHQVIIEIGESAMTDGGSTVARHLADLRDAGASIVLDDFGLSHASMRTLHAFAFDGVKLHNSLLTEGDSRRGSAIANAVYASAETVGFDVVHTGIDTDDDLRTLMELAQSTSDAGLYAQGAAVSARTASLVSG